MNDEQLLRYSRQIMLPQIDIEGQERLLEARVLILGLGGLGCPAAQYLAAAGVGQMVLVDPDTVDTTNLQRQLLYSSLDQGTPKAEAAKNRLSAINGGVEFEVVEDRLEGEALFEQVSKATVVLDCTDNFSSRFAINAACVRAGVPLVSGAAIRLNGQLSVYDRRQPDAPCYRCLYDEQSNESLSCSESGILGPVVGTIGTMQALETIKLITGFGKTLHGRLMIFDAMTMEWQTMGLQADPDCPVCGHDR
ncbi:HesA/MoeB/ThiF family protein [Endozoicomonas elysicola]|uniref:Molybdopterin-synthase adenylyltransferase n=1 Tax=Endozoicomonas elysicola TaxID=305900 RepID=A0A081K6I4_9GAMM|nr:molybdopterin-synthase adenylyltransferase MoeB [Endozoicomonas elysicola]KEI69760.1 molybdopterin-synthase adenylyltransferase [Endozoicomonas elysicola]